MIVGDSLTCLQYQYAGLVVIVGDCLTCLQYQYAGLDVIVGHP